MYSKELETTWYQDIEKLRKLIESFNHVVIIPHANADPDALASSCALAYLLRELRNDLSIVIAIPEGVGLECRKLLEICSKNGINITIVKKSTTDIIKDNSLCFLIDVASLEQVKIVKNYIDRCENVVVIDHHSIQDYSSTSLPPSKILKFVRVDVSSTSEIVFSMITYFHIAIPKEILEMLISGILWDTKQLTRVSPTTLRYIADILELGADYQKARSFISIAKPPHVKIAKIKCILRHRAFKITLDQNEIYVAISEVGAYESDCASTLIGIGYDLAFVASEDESLNAVRIIYRVREDLKILQKIDVYNDILKPLVQRYGGGGGGHKAAGGAVISTPNIDVILRELVEVLNNLAKGRIVELAEEKVIYR